jgi:hypothetical protein
MAVGCIQSADLLCDTKYTRTLSAEIGRDYIRHWCFS